MPKVAYGDSGVVLDFPDTMSQDEIAAAIKKNEPAIKQRVSQQQKPSEAAMQEQPGIISDIATAGKEAIGDVVSGFQRLSGALQSNPSFPQASELSAQADALNRATKQMEEEARVADTATGSKMREFAGTTIRGAGRSLIEGAAMAPAGPYGMIAGAAGIQANQAATEAGDARVPITPRPSDDEIAKQFETKLSADDEAKFQQWKAKYAPKDSGYDYDLRGAYLDGLTPNPETGHWPDKFKKPNHPTFSNESMYAKDMPERAGSWQGETYIPPTGDTTRPLTGMEKARYVAEQAVMEALPAAVMQKVGLGGFEKQMSEAFKGGAKGIKAGLKAMAKDVGLELPEELVTSIGQQISTSKELEGKNPSEITGEQWGQLIRDTTAQTVLAGGMAGLPGLVPSKSPQKSPQATNAPEPTSTSTGTLNDFLATVNGPNDTSGQPPINPAPEGAPPFPAVPEPKMAPKAPGSAVYAPESLPPVPNEPGTPFPGVPLRPEVQQGAPSPNLRTMTRPGQPVPATPAPPTHALVRSMLERMTPEEFDAWFARRMAQQPGEAPPIPGSVAYAPEQKSATPKPFTGGTSQAEFNPAPEQQAPEQPSVVPEPEMPRAGTVLPSTALGPMRKSTPADAVDVIQQLNNDLGRAPSLSEVADALGSNRHTARKVIDAHANGDTFDNAPPASSASKGLFNVGKTSQPQAAAPVQPQPQQETPNGKEAANEAQGKRQAAEDVLNAPAGVAPTPAPAPQPQEPPAPAPAPVEPAAPAAPEAAATPEAQPPSAPVDAPIRFKRTGKGDASVHEATIEGRPVAISKGKDGWEVRLDGKVADVRPTLTEARGYATGELRQDLVDQRNAAEEEAQASQPNWLVEAMQREGKNPGRLLHEVDLGNRSVSDALKNDPIVAQMLSVEPELGARALKGNVSASEVSDFIKRNPPAPADTGIFRDLTAAAREGKRFVEELHARIAPVLARIHAQAKSAVDFVRQAVAKIGEHIRPYAKRFLADVRKVNAEFAANPTRGSGPVWFSKLSNAVEDKMGGAMDAGELRKMLEGAGVKADEMKWARLGDLNGKVSKKEVREHIAANAIKVEEVHTVDNKKRIHYLLLDEGGEVEGSGDEISANRWRSQGIPESRIKEEEVAAQGSTKFSDYQTPGGENYGELLLTLPHDSPFDAAFKWYLKNASTEQVERAKRVGAVSSSDLQEANAPKELVDRFLGEQKDRTAFKSSHFNEPNILVHVRHNDRTDAYGKRVLFLEEVQSDWHQEGRKKGYAQDFDKITKDDLVVTPGQTNGVYEIHDKTGRFITNVHSMGGDIDAMKNEAIRRLKEEPERTGAGRNKGVPDAPFKSTEDWTALAMRRMVRYAAEHGYDKIAWTTGDMQVERYDLSKQVDSVHYNPDTWKLVALKDGQRVVDENNVPPEKLESYVGKEAAKNLMDTEPNSNGQRSIAGEQLKVGGSGMRKHYDEVMRNVANKIGKKWGARAGTTYINLDPRGGSQRLRMRVASDGKKFWVEPVSKLAGRDALSEKFDTFIEADDARQRIYNGFDTRVHSLDIPPTMRDEVNIKGMPIFADTGILRDIEAAAKQGKKWVAELHERAAPELAKLYAKAKGAVDFVKQAVAKFGDAIRPYAKRFLAEVKRGVRDETGAVIKPSAAVQAMRQRRAEYAQGKKDVARTIPEEKRLSREEAKAEGKAATQEASKAGFEEGLTQGLKVAGMAHKEFTEFWNTVKDVVPADRLEKRVKAINRLAAMKSVSPEKRAENIAKVVEAVRREAHQRNLINGVTAQVKKLNKNMRNMTEELRDTAREVLDSFIVSKPTEKTIAKARALVQAVADGETVAHPKALAKAEKAIEASISDTSLSSMSNDDLRALKSVLEEINTLHETDLEAAKQKREAQKQEYAQAAQDVVNDTKNVFTGDESKRKGLLQAYRELSLNVFNKLLSLAPEDSTLHRLAIKTTNEGENVESAHRIKARSYIMGVLEKLKGSDGVPLAKRNPSDDSYTLHPELTNMSYLLSDYANKTGVGKVIARKRGKAPKLIAIPISGGRTIKLSQAERARLYQLGLDPNARYQITREDGEGIYLPRTVGDKIFKLTAQDLTAIESTMTDNEKAIAKAMFDFDNGEVKKVVNEMSRREFSRDIFNEDDKTSYRRYMHDQDVSSMNEHVGKTFLENQGMLKEIRGGKAPIILSDVFSEYFAHQMRVAAIVGRMPASIRLRELASTEAFRSAVRKKGPNGESVLRDIDKIFNSYGEVSTNQDPAMWIVNGILSRLASSWLGLNPKTIITTPMSVWSMQSRIPLQYLVKNISVRTRNAAALDEMRKYAPKMYEMVTGSGFNVVSPETTGESGQRFFGKGPRGHEKLQFFLHESNNIPAFMGWNAAKDWGASQGLKGEDLMRFMAEKAQDAYSVSQPDNRWIYTSGAKREARTSALWRTLTFLQGQTAKQYNQSWEAAVRYRRSQKTAADKARLIKDFSIPTIAQALLYTATGYAVKAGYDEWDKLRGKDGKRVGDKTLSDFAFDTARNFAENATIVGPIVGDAADIVRRVRKGQNVSMMLNGPESVLGRPIALTFKALADATAYMTDPSDDKFTKARRSIITAASMAGFSTDAINAVLDAMGD